MSIKIRNRFIALVCLLLFIGLGMLFYVNWVVQKPFAVIIFLTDNLSTSTLTAARIYQNGADNRLRLEQFPHLGLLRTHAADFAVSDPAAASTAIATGKRVNNRSVGVDSDGRLLPTIFDAARKKGRAVGLVTKSSLSDPAVAAFFAHTQNPKDAQTIAAQLVDAANIDVILGGGEADFLPELKEGHRNDGRDLMLEMRRKGYDLARNKSELESTPLFHPPKLFGVFSLGNLAFADEIQSAGPQPTLSDMVRMAIQLLQYNRKGYVLVVDCSLVGQAAYRNEGERMLRELLAVDEAVESAVNYAGENSLILVAGRQSIGGLKLNGYPFRNDKGVAVVGINAQGVPSLTWSTGPGGQKAPEASGATAPAASDEPAAFVTPSAVGVAEDGIIVGSGPGSEKLDGFKDNTDIYQTVVENL